MWVLAADDQRLMAYGIADGLLRPMAVDVTTGRRASSRREEPEMEQTGGFWAEVMGVAASPAAIAAGIVRGSYDAATGSGAFDDGFHAAADPMIASARKFGSEHKETITRGMLGGAAATLGARIVNESLRHLKR